MDNKLSELSRPVAEIRKHYPLGIDTPASVFFQPLEGLSAVNFGDLLYSQEYVSALLAELEAKDNRIAELEAKTAMTMGVGDGSGSLFVHGDYDSIKAVQAIIINNERLRAKLATPIKIVNYDEFFICHVTGASDDYCKGWVDGRNAAARDVVKAGFTVGDE